MFLFLFIDLLFSLFFKLFVLLILTSSDIPKPNQIFLGAHGPNTKRELLDFSPSELDKWVKERTLKFGTVPEKLINNKTFWRMYLPLYRADYTLLAGYNFDDLAIETDIPVTIFYSEKDTPLSEMKQWEKYFRGSIDYNCYEGQHFFIQQHHEDIARIISKKMLGNNMQEGQEGWECENHAV